MILMQIVAGAGCITTWPANYAEDESWMMTSAYIYQDSNKNLDAHDIVSIEGIDCSIVWNTSLRYDLEYTPDSSWKPLRHCTNLEIVTSLPVGHLGEYRDKWEAIARNIKPIAKLVCQGE